MKRFWWLAFLSAIATGILVILVPLTSSWFSHRLLPGRLAGAAGVQLDRLEAMHRRAWELRRQLDRPVLPGWEELESLRAHFIGKGFLLIETPAGQPHTWAGEPLDLSFQEGIRAAFTPNGAYLIHGFASRWGLFTIGQRLPDLPRSLFISSAAYQPVRAYPTLPGPGDPDTRTFLFKPGGGPPVLSLQLKGVSADRAVQGTRKILGGLLAAVWLVLLALHARTLPLWLLPLLVRLALVVFPFALLPLPVSWIRPTAFSLPWAGPLTTTPLEAALTLLAGVLSLAGIPWRPLRGWFGWTGCGVAGVFLLLTVSSVAVHHAVLAPVPTPLAVALPVAAWGVAATLQRLRPIHPVPRVFPWLAAALAFLPLVRSFPLLFAVLCLGAIGLTAWRREPFVSAAWAGLWGLVLPYALLSEELQRTLEGPQAALRLQRPALEVLELSHALPVMLEGLDWADRQEFSLLEDEAFMAEALARGLGLENRGVEYAVTVERNGRAVSHICTTRFPGLETGVLEEGVIRRQSDHPDLYAGIFPLAKGGKGWGRVIVQFRARPPTAPASGPLPILVGLYDGLGNPLESRSVFLPSRLEPHARLDLPGWYSLFAEGDRRTLFFLPAWEFPFPYLAFALLLLAGVFLSLPRPMDLHSLLSLVLLPLVALTALALMLAFVFTARQEHALRALMEQWTAVAQQNLLKEVTEVIPDLVFRDGLLVDGNEAGPSLRFAPAAVMADLPRAQPRSVLVRGRPYLFFVDTEGLLCALQQPNLPGIERPVGWLARRTWGILLSCLASALILVHLLLRRFTEPVTRLAETARALRHGEPFTPGALSASREINDLAAALSDAIDRLTHEERTLREILAALPVGVALARDGVLLYQNQPMTLSGLVQDPRAFPESGTCAREGRLYLTRRIPLPRDRYLLLASDITAEVTAEKLMTFAEIARIVAHEVKNPLTPIRLSIEYLRELLARDADRFRRDAALVLDEVVHSVDDLEHAATEFADFARLPALRKERHDLNTLLGDWLAPYAASGTLRFFASAQPLPLEADPRLLKRALFNLLANAWQSTTPPPAVTVRLERGADAVFIAVEDEGPGVPSETESRLFEPYFTTKSSGTGLGLLIARRIVEEHGGTIAARNRPESGLRVDIRLPLAAEAPPAVQPPE